MWGWDRKICPSWSPFVITRQASWCQTVILWTDFSIPPSYSWWALIYSHTILFRCLYPCEINRIQWGQKNPNPRAQRSSGKRGLPSSPLNGGPEGWDFSGTTEHQWSILFLIYHDRTVLYCVLSVGDVTEVDVYVQSMMRALQINLKQRINSALNNEKMVVSS